MCHDSGFCVATGFGLGRVFLVHDRGCSMSQQKFPCRDQDGQDKRSGLRRSLVKAKRFHVAT